MARNLQGKEIKNFIVRGKSALTGLCLIISQIVICIIHGNYIRPIIQNDVTLGRISIISFFIPIVLALASTLGFGLLFSYTKKLILSGLGFSFFITAYSLQFYPLINSLWVSTKLFKANYLDALTQKPFFLSQYVINTSKANPQFVNNFNLNNIQGCFRSAIAINIAISCVLGKIQLFQVLITIFLGTFGYQLNRRICSDNFGDDALGSMYIFAFGGFMGLAMGLILRFQDRKLRNSARNKYYTADQFSITLSFLGAAILMISLPFFTQLHHKNFQMNPSSFYTPVLSTLLSISSGLMGTLIVSLILKGQIIARDFIHGPISGAIIGGASSYFTANLAWCIALGLFGGIIQSLVQIYIQKKISQQHRIISTVSFTLFGVQGFLASILACISKAIIQSNTSLPYTHLNYKTINLFIYGIISSLMGFGFGIIIGIICYLLNLNIGSYYNDKRVWITLMDQEPPQTSILPQDYFKTPRSHGSSSVSTLKPPDVIDIPY